MLGICFEIKFDKDQILKVNVIINLNEIKVNDTYSYLISE